MWEDREWWGDELKRSSIITFQRAMTKKTKRSSVFKEKIGWHHQLPPRVTSTLVTPLNLLLLFVLLLVFYYYYYYYFTLSTYMYIPKWVLKLLEMWK